MKIQIRLSREGTPTKQRDSRRPRSTSRKAVRDVVREASRSIERIEIEKKQSDDPTATLTTPAASSPMILSKSKKSGRSHSQPKPLTVKDNKATTVAPVAQQPQQQQLLFTNTTCPFDINGYCTSHPDVQMAKRREQKRNYNGSVDGYWTILLKECPKCCALLKKNNVERNTYDKATRQCSGDTESMTSDDEEEEEEEGEKKKLIHHIPRRHLPPPQQERGRHSQQQCEQTKHTSGGDTVVADNRSISRSKRQLNAKSKLRGHQHPPPPPDNSKQQRQSSFNIDNSHSKDPLRRCNNRRGSQRQHHSRTPPPPPRIMERRSRSFHHDPEEMMNLRHSLCSSQQSRRHRSLSRGHYSDYDDEQQKYDHDHDHHRNHSRSRSPQHHSRCRSRTPPPQQHRPRRRLSLFSHRSRPHQHENDEYNNIDHSWRSNHSNTSRSHSAQRRRRSLRSLSRSSSRYLDEQSRYEQQTRERRSLSRNSSRRSSSGSFRGGRHRSKQSSRAALSSSHPVDQISTVRRTINVNGRPIDKSGKCFIHPHVKLASKKLLGGWKIHMHYCPLCLQQEDDDKGGGYNYYDEDGNYYSNGGGVYTSSDNEGGEVYDSDYTGSTISGVSRMADDNHVGGGGDLDTSHRSNHSRRSRGSMRSISSSYRSYDDGVLVGSRSTARSNKSNVSGSSRSKHRRSKTGGNEHRNDESLLPLDEDGYCVHHPNVQLAKMSKRGGLKILMDACPECCAEESQHVEAEGGNKSCKAPSSHGGSASVASASSSRNRRPSVDSSCKSGKSSRSAKSGSSHSTYIEDMPYIDGDGNTGHYTGHVDSENGHPNGKGKMKYTNGMKFDGVWIGGTKVHGKLTSKKYKKIKEKQQQQKKKKEEKKAITPERPPPPPPPLLPKKKLPGQTRSNIHPDIKTHGQEYKNNDIDDSDLCSQGTSTSASIPASSSRGRSSNNKHLDNGTTTRSRRSLSRLRRKCDEIESLLRGVSKDIAAGCRRDSGIDSSSTSTCVGDTSHIDID